MNTAAIYLTATALIAGCLIACAGVCYSRALDRALTDLHSISTDMHAIRESVAPPSVKIKFRTGPSKMEMKKPEIVA